MKTIIPNLHLCGVLLLLLFFSSCGNYGTVMRFNNSELYYTNSITTEEATRLGDYLTQEDFFDNHRKTVQLGRSGNKYIFKLVVATGTENNNELTEVLRIFTQDLSQNVFNGAMVDIHLCDDLMNTVKVIPFSRCTAYGRKLNFNGAELFYAEDVNRTTVQRLGHFLVDESIYNGEKISTQISKNGTTYEFRIVVSEGIENDTHHLAYFTELSRRMSDTVFNGAAVDIHLCDNLLKTKKVVSLAQR